MDKDTEAKIQQLQAIEQNMQSYNIQKQTIQSQILESEFALRELENTTTAYKIIGNIMVASNKDELIKEITNKLSLLKTRFEKIEKQESRLQKEAEELQKEVMTKVR